MTGIRIAKRRPPAGAGSYPPHGRTGTPHRAARGASLLLALALLVLCAFAAGSLHAESDRADGAGARPVLVIDVKGAIGVGTAEYIARAIERARRDDARLVVIRLDTPGGLVSATREIISAMLAAPVPVAVLVAPAGARAASAGTYMMYAAHIAAMAPGTHLGAATPITMGSPLPSRDTDKDKDSKGEKSDDKDGMTAGERKSVNDAVAYLRALAELRGRNADWAERAVRTAATLTSTAAEKENVVDLLARDVPDLLRKIDGRAVTVAGAERRLATKDPPIVTFDADWRIKIMSVIGDPTIAYLLLLIGFYGIIFEFWNPGSFAPGVIGGVSLLLALGGLSVLPVSYAGLGLVVLGVALLTAEVFTPGIGVLGIGGLVAFVAGSVLLYDPDAARGVDFAVAWPVIAGAAVTSALFFAFGLGLAMRSRRRPVVSGRESMIGSPGVVVRWEGARGAVRVQGEVWSARAASAFAPGDRVRVAGLEGLTVTVEPGREES
jgi:membrane-bound serine protease (ClpP class)